MRLLSVATMATVAATSARTLTGGKYDLQRPTTVEGDRGDVEAWSVVAPGVPLRFRPLRADESPSVLGVEEGRAYRVAYAAHLSPAPRSGWRFASPDGRDVFAIVGIEEDPAGGSAVSYAVCGRTEAR